MGVEVAADEKGVMGNGKCEKMMEVRALVDDVVIIVNDK
jgi:hypothetical protein